MATFTLAQLKQKHGNAPVQKIFTLDDLKQKQDLASQIRGNRFEREKEKRKGFRGFLTKTRDVAAAIVGGGKLAEGAGQAIAAPGVQRSLEESSALGFDLEKQLIERIRQNREAGEDVSSLENTLQKQRDLSVNLADAQKDFAESLVSTKEVIGSAIRLGTTFAAGTIAGAAGKVTKVAKATTLAGGAVRGAAAGAISGGVIGGAAGAGIGLEQEKDIGGVAKTAAGGAVGGALVGGAIGAVVGGVSGSLRGRKQAAESFAKELATEKGTPKVRAKAIFEGRLKDPGAFKKAELDFSRRDIQLGDSIDDVVSKKASVGQNVDAIRKKISDTNSGVKDFITKNKTIFNQNQLKSKLNQGRNELDLVFASDATAERTYDKLVDIFTKDLGKKDTLGLFLRRQEFDKLPAVKKLLDSQALGENAKKEIVLTLRKAVNEFTASQLPTGNTFRADLLQEHYMLEALTNLSKKSQGIVGKNKLQLIVNEYPVLKWVIGGFATGIAGAAGIGVGGAIVGSTD